MRRVVASGNGVDVVEFVAVKSPVADELCRELLVILLHFRQGGTQRGQAPHHARVLAVLVEDQPVRVLLDDPGQAVGVRLIAPLAVFDPERYPPDLRANPLLVKLLDHFLDSVVREGVRAGAPVTVLVEPAVVERRPPDVELLQLRNGAQHLRGRDVELVSPAAPEYIVGFFRWLPQGPTFTLKGSRVEAQGLVEITGIDGDEAARRREYVAGPECRVRLDRERRADAAVGLGPDGQ